MCEGCFVDDVFVLWMMTLSSLKIVTRATDFP